MWPFGWLSDLREVATLLDRVRRVAHADDEIPIDEHRAPDGEVARCASLIRETLTKAPARHQPALNRELAGLLRRLGPAERLEADGIYRRLRAEAPSNNAIHWNHALLLKRLGRFDEALAALDAYASAGGERDKPFRWNTGICATGAGLGQKALDMWLAEGFKIALGRRHARGRLPRCPDSHLQQRRARRATVRARCRSSRLRVRLGQATQPVPRRAADAARDGRAG